MAYPNTNQMSALLRRPVNYDYGADIDAQVAQLPALLQLQEQRDYNDAQIKQGQQSLDIQMANQALAEETAETNKKQQLYGNILAGINTGIAGYQALNSAFDGSGAGETAATAIQSLSAPAATESATTALTGGSSPLATVGSTSVQPEQSWAGSAIQGVGEGINEYIIEPVTSAVKKVGSSVGEFADDAWNSVTSFVDSIFG